MLVTGATDVLGEKPFSVPLCPLQVPHGLVTCCLSHHVASEA